MKKVHLIVLATMGLPTAALADNNFYIKLEGGPATTSNTMRIKTYVADNSNGNAGTYYPNGIISKIKKPATAYNLGVSIGYYISPSIRSELSYINFSQSGKYHIPKTIVESATDFINPDIGIKLSRMSQMFMLNAYYDLRSDKDFTPFIGFGIGYGKTRYNIDRFVNNSGRYILEDFVLERSDFPSNSQYQLDKDAMSQDNSKKIHSQIIWSHKSGFSYKLNKNTVVQLSYGLTLLPKAETAAPTQAFLRFWTDNSQSVALQFKGPRILHSADLGMRFIF